MRKADRTGGTWHRPRWIPEEIIDAADVCFMILETDGRIIYFNRAMENLVGRRTGDVYGTAVQDIVKPAQRAVITEVLQETRVRGTAFWTGMHRSVAWTFSLVTRPGWGRPALVGVGMTDGIASAGRRTGPELQLVTRRGLFKG